MFGTLNEWRVMMKGRLGVPTYINNGLINNIVNTFKITTNIYIVIRYNRDT
jgi:hypothetical protein